MNSYMKRYHISSTLKYKILDYLKFKWQEEKYLK